MRIASIAEHSVETPSPTVESVLFIDGVAEVVAACNLLYFYTVFFEVSNFLGNEMGFEVTVTECTNILAVHPAEHARLSSIAPSPHVAIISQRNGMVVTQCHIDNAETQLLEFLDHFRHVKLDVFFVAMA